MEFVDSQEMSRKNKNPLLNRTQGKSRTYISKFLNHRIQMVAVYSLVDPLTGARGKTPGKTIEFREKFGKGTYTTDIIEEQNFIEKTGAFKSGVVARDDRATDITVDEVLDKAIKAREKKALDTADENTVKCDACDRIFRSDKGLEKHQERIHGKAPSES